MILFDMFVVFFSKKLQNSIFIFTSLTKHYSNTAFLIKCFTSKKILEKIDINN